MKNLVLNSGQKMPAIGLGTWKMEGIKCTKAVEKAIELGYRHIDTAYAYKNHQDIAPALSNTNVARDELFITSKVMRYDLKYNDFIEMGNKILDDLALDYLDLLLIHWPNKEISIKETLEAMAELKEKGKIKNAGVSNFTISHIKEAFEYYPELIAVNQIECHPYLYQKELLQFCRDNDIVITAYSPLAQGKILNDPIIKNLAERLDKTPAQIVLKWLVEKDIVVIPKASSTSHLKNNMDILDWELTNDVQTAVNNLNKNERLINPSFAEFDYKL